jgi:hypothetical protein
MWSDITTPWSDTLRAPQAPANVERHIVAAGTMQAQGRGCGAAVVSEIAPGLTWHRSPRVCRDGGQQVC